MKRDGIFFWIGAGLFLAAALLMTQVIGNQYPFFAGYVILQFIVLAVAWSISNAMKEMGQEPFRLLTDVTGEPFWTLVAEAKVEKVDDFFAIEEKLMTNETIRKTMADYHDLVESGRREIYRVES